MDNILLLLPPLITGLWRQFSKKNLGALIGGSAPFFLWIIFTIIYYGFPFPNSAYAKLHTGIGNSERIHQGFLYLLNSIDPDPLTLLVILAAFSLASWRRDRQALSISSGILLYLAYIVYIGGDFMSGRFLTAPFFASVILISQARFSPPRLELFVFLLLLIVALSSPPTTLQSDSHYSRTEIDDRGIADERGFYCQASDLLKENRRSPLPRHDWVSDGKRARAERGVYVRGNIGYFGFFAGPRAHVVDPLGLSDALISRLPARKNLRWRVGHYNREIPEGYFPISDETRLFSQIIDLK
jgi:arabinofuranosyltransferase